MRLYANKIRVNGYLHEVSGKRVEGRRCVVITLELKTEPPTTVELDVTYNEGLLLVAELLRWLPTPQLSNRGKQLYRRSRAK